MSTSIRRAAKLCAASGHSCAIAASTRTRRFSGATSAHDERSAGIEFAARGGASLGDKTVLDGLHAVATALAASPETEDARQVASAASHAALEAFRDKPNRIGRARMFADKTIGLDDPGMVALQRMIDSL